MIFLQVETMSPVSFSKGHPVGNQSETLDYIPGTALRGALAMEYLRQNPGSENSKEFKSFFLSDAVRFGNLYPCKKASFSKPFPATARTCKQVKGFTSEESKRFREQPHGVFDALIPFLCIEGKGKQGVEKCFLKKEIEKTDECSCCKSPLDKITGFYEDSSGYARVTPSKRLIERTAISEATESAEFGALYTLEALEEGQKFAGYIDASQEDGKLLIDKLLGQERSLHLGASRRRGLGMITVLDASWGESFLELEPLENRLQKFEAKLNEFGFPQDVKRRFALTLYSDAIILDDYMRYQSFIDQTILRRELGVDINKREDGEDKEDEGGLKLFRQFASAYIISGWNLKLGLPKEDDFAIRMGSVFVFESDGIEESHLLSILKQVEKDGLGERKNEGFGKVIVCDTFHQEVEVI